MAKPKKEVKFNVVSMRISDAEKKTLDEITRRSHITISDLLRQAMQRFALSLEENVQRR